MHTRTAPTKPTFPEFVGFVGALPGGVQENFLLPKTPLGAITTQLPPIALSCTGDSGRLLGGNFNGKNRPISLKNFQGRQIPGSKTLKPSTGAGFQAYKHFLIVSDSKYFQK